MFSWIFFYLELLQIMTDLFPFLYLVCNNKSKYCFFLPILVAGYRYVEKKKKKNHHLLTQLRLNLRDLQRMMGDVHRFAILIRAFFQLNVM